MSKFGKPGKKFEKTSANPVIILLTGIFTTISKIFLEKKLNID